ncbi:fatty acyl-CoA reductase wat-like [Zophobas morio]|uniref:fatty acyl-CoA reductase wat-like n=1 Tax=Zophobas morio TaxID=2755281 RepID=UPI00308320DA
MTLDNSQIKLTFKKQTLFLTGATGFLGKVMMAKLLTDCDDIKKIYILLRSKKGKTTEQRFKEIFLQPCFEVLRSKTSKWEEKISFIAGDCEEPYLGISKENLKILKNEVNFVIHLAANVRFDQSLKKAASSVKSTVDLLELSKDMVDLKCFVLVSTAYSNCINFHIKEEIYDPPMQPELLFSMVNGLDENILTNLTPALLKKWPNTYVYTKCISEHLVKSAVKHFPATIVRPSIIMNSIKEPVPGWIDNTYGPISVVIGAMLGIIRTMHGDSNVLGHVVPVDYVCNCILAATWKTATEKKSNTTVFNYIGFNRKQLNWGQFYSYINSCYWRMPFQNLIWYQIFKLRGKLGNQIFTFLLHTIPAYLIDAVLYCIGKPTKAVKAYAKIDKVLMLMSYFGTHNFDFDEDNVRYLWTEMSAEDRKLFNFSMEDLQWKNYLYTCTLGFRRYLTKDPPIVRKKTYVKLYSVMVAHYLIVAVFCFLLYKFVTIFFNSLW